jgi:hypothetical protein
MLEPVPKGLPQAVQAKGSSSLRMRLGVSQAAKSICGAERDRGFGAGRGAEAALHAGAFGEAQHRLVGVVRQRARRAHADAGMAQRAGVEVEGHGAEGRALRAAAMRSAGAGACAVHLEHGGGQEPALVLGRQERRARGAARARDRAKARPPARRVVGLDQRHGRHLRGRSPSRPRPSAPACRGARRADVGRAARGQEPHAARAPGERGGDEFGADLVVSLISSGMTSAGRPRPKRARHRSAPRRGPRHGTGSQARSCRPPRTRRGCRCAGGGEVSTAGSA